MTEESALVPIEQKQVEFYDDKILAVRVRDGTVYVPVRPICELLGISWPSQRNRIRRDEVLSEVVENISVFITNTQGEEGQHREMLCLPLDFVSGFLFGITGQRVKPAVKPRLLQYQKECYRVLNEAFFEGRLTSDPSFEALLESDSPAAQAYKTFQALTKLARNQLILESRVQDHEERLERVEATLGHPGRYVTPAQAGRISQAVKAIAMQLSKKSGRNEYGGVYGELYRRFDIASYRELPAGKYDAAMSWLNEWYQQVAGSALPF